MTVIGTALAMTVLAILFLVPLVGGARDFLQELPTTVQQLRDSEELSSWFGDSGASGNVQEGAQKVATKIPEAISGVLGIAGSFFTVFIAAFSILFICLFLLTDIGRLKEALGSVLMPGDEVRWLAVWERVTESVSRWAIGVVVIADDRRDDSGLDRVAARVELRAGPGLIAGLLDMIPNIGATIAGFILVPTLWAEEGLTAAVIMLVVVLVYQQVENNIITPKVQGKAVNLSAFFIIVSVILFGGLLGVLGALTAVPLAAMIQIFVQELTKERRARVAAVKAAIPPAPETPPRPSGSWPGGARASASARAPSAPRAAPGCGRARSCTCGAASRSPSWPLPEDSSRSRPRRPAASAPAGRGRARARPGRPAARVRPRGRRSGPAVGLERGVGGRRGRAGLVQRSLEIGVRHERDSAGELDAAPWTCLVGDRRALDDVGDERAVRRPRSGSSRRAPCPSTRRGSSSCSGRRRPRGSRSSGTAETVTAPSWDASAPMPRPIRSIGTNTTSGAGVRGRARRQDDGPGEQSSSPTRTTRRGETSGKSFGIAERRDEQGDRERQHPRRRSSIAESPRHDREVERDDEEEPGLREELEEEHDQAAVSCLLRRTPGGRAAPGRARRGGLPAEEQPEHEEPRR